MPYKRTDYEKIEKEERRYPDREYQGIPTQPSKRTKIRYSDVFYDNGIKHTCNDRLKLDYGRVALIDENGDSHWEDEVL